MKNVKFSAGSYENFSNLSGYIIYCDPPYQKQSHYYTEDGKHIESFDHNKFWSWCRRMSENNIIFLSEYKSPKDLIYYKRKKAPITKMVIGAFLTIPSVWV